jgi:ATP-binding cassette subfamily B protein
MRAPQRHELDYVRQVVASPDASKEVEIFGLSPFLLERDLTISCDSDDASR